MDDAPGTEYQSRRRREIAKIIDDMNSQLLTIAESHNSTSSRRVILRHWKVNVVDRARLLTLAKQGGAAMLNRNKRKGLNGWVAMVTQKAMMLMQLKAAAKKMRNRGLTKAYNQLVAAQQARRRKLAAMSNAARSFLNRALLKGWNKLAAAGRLRAKMKRAASQILHRNKRKGLNGWMAMVAERAHRLMLLQGAAKSFANRAFRKARDRRSNSAAHVSMR